MEQIELYTAVVDAVQRGNPLPEDAIIWMAEAIFYNAQTGVSVDEALGLKTPGNNARTIRDQHLRAVRDRALARAYSLIDGNQPRQRAKLLLNRLQRFADSRTFRFGHPPRNDLEQELLEAFSTDLRLPQTINGLLGVLERQGIVF